MTTICGKQRYDKCSAIFPHASFSFEILLLILNLVFVACWIFQWVFTGAKYFAYLNSRICSFCRCAAVITEEDRIQKKEKCCALQSWQE